MNTVFKDPGHHSFPLPEQDPHLRYIERVYGDTTAKRSGVPYIQHIKEGLEVMLALGSSESAMQAYCLHPIFQADDDLEKNHMVAASPLFSPHALVLTMEYRKTANAYLSFHLAQNKSARPKLSPIPSVNEMLIADKVQNYKDFEKFHKGSHPQTEILESYFKHWLAYLGVCDADYEKAKKLMEQL